MKYFIWTILSVCVVLFGIVYMITGCSKDVVKLEEPVTTVIDKESSEVTTDKLEQSALCVYVCGCVNNPGVYYFNNGARVFDAVNAAGGVTAECNINAVNQAEPLIDGQQLYMPSKNEQGNIVQAGNNDSGLININKATADELMTLPGIGQSKADSIIAYREENGGFNNIEDIMNISGIKEAAFNKIKDKICV